MSTADDDTKVIVKAGDLPPVETTLGGIKEVARRARKRAGNFEPDPQQAFEEKVIEDPDLEELLNERFLTANGARRYGTANRKMKKLIEERGLEDDVRYRVGEYVFRLKTTDRDGFEVESGTSRRFAELTVMS